MDERIIAVLKAAAIEHVEDNDYTLGECVFCHSEDAAVDNKQSDRINHHPGCETLLARDILKSLGSPVCEYYVTGEQRHESRSGWRTLRKYVQGYTEEEIRSHLPNQKGQFPQFRNVEIELIKEL